MKSILPFDEIEQFRLWVAEIIGDRSEGKEQLTKEEEEDIIDEMLDLFLLAYARGVEVTNEDLAFNWQPPIEEVMKTVDAEVAGKTWRQRVKEYFTKARNGEIPNSSGQTPAGSQGGKESPDTESGQTNLTDALTRIAETEAHRDANDAALKTATKAGATSKTWHCMMLPTSRDSHIYLDGVTVPIDGEFYSFNGGSTQFPGEWGIAEEDINCLCWLTFKK